ncbi:hypothetical protein VTN49DRAFT_282 [Thermomyces lanuginosus]|uniref:uncharacterized protein n=1 Tax=Thermomyces lanuginosus TaxID=5541 RepID=UPI0037449B33
MMEPRSGLAPRPGYADSGGTPAPRPESPAPPQHRRGYQACDPCRKRKVKCDLGSVDNPRPPPCVRCRRESKRCEFSATRRKRKPTDREVDESLRRDKRMMVGEVVYNDGADGSSSQDSPYSNDPRRAPYGADNSPPTATVNPSATTSQWPPPPPPPSASSYKPTSQTPGKDQFSAHPSPSPLYSDVRSSSRSYQTQGRSFLEHRSHVMNKTAADLLSPTISNSHDALHLLSEAAGRTEDLNRQGVGNGVRQPSSYGQSMSGVNSPSQHTRSAAPKPPRSTSSESQQQQQPVESRQKSVIAPELQDLGYLDAVKAWSRLRFVRAGWLTVEEAMAYIAYYYEHLAPLSPIVIPDFSPPSTHRTLLTDEPVLAVTMLTTASRHMLPKGDGAHTRGYYIHDRLWAYLRGMIERLFWGQEKFAGNSYTTSTPRSLDLRAYSNPAQHRGHLRSLGTVEALLILTDWHPRNLHFPPGDDENTLLDADALLPPQRDNEGDSKGPSSGLEGRVAFQKWLEPTWRADRMSWMLLSAAQALAFELGVFDDKAPSGNESVAEQARKRRVRRLILVYVTQSSGRLGIPSMLPLPQWSHDINPVEPYGTSEADAAIDQMQEFWLAISWIMYQSNHLLFASKEQTSELIKTGMYKQRIAEFSPALRDFKRRLDSAPLRPQMRQILTIEYEYTRVYVNCLALQAVVERWTTMNNDPANRPGPGNPSSINSLRVLMELYRVNEKYIQEVVDASRKILQTVLESLVPGDHLKHCPVRTFFRILSGMIFILKTFTLGATEDDVRISLDLQDRTIEALRTCVVDDVHLSNTISRLLELLTTNIRTRFLRFAPTDRTADGDGQDRASAENSRVTSPRLKEGGAAGGSRSWTTLYSNQPPTSSSEANPNAGNDPLASIPAQPINSSTITASTASFMPPPPSVYYNFYDTATTTTINNNHSPTSTTANENRTSPPPANTSASSTATPNTDDPASITHNVPEGGLPDWFALPLDQFFNSATAGVDTGLGGTGPMVGELDMLEVLLNEQQDPVGGSSSTTGGNPGNPNHHQNGHASNTTTNTNTGTNEGQGQNNGYL